MDLSMKRFIFRAKGRQLLSSDLQLRFLKRLVRLLSNGYPLIEGLETLKWDPAMKQAAGQVITALKKGLLIDEAFAAADFHNSITSQLYFARTHNDLQGSIQKCHAMYEQRLKHLKKFQQVIRYPTVLASVFLLLLFFIRQSVLPSFIGLFETSANRSSAVELSIFLIDLLGVLLLLTFLLFAACFIFWKTSRKKLDTPKQLHLLKKIPLVRKYVRLHTSFLFAAHLSSLLKTGLPMKEVFLYMSRQDRLPFIRFYSEQMTNQLRQGLPIGRIIQQYYFFEPQLAAIFQKHADNEALEKDLDTYATLLTEEIQRKISKALVIIQPLFFAVLAGFIIFIYVTLMWPMFQLIQSI